MNALQPTEILAVLTLSETGEILAAREACMAVFGRDVGALIGVNIRVLLKGGLDNEVGRLLHGHRSGKNPAETAPLHVVALRKDGTEFMACATTRKWNLDTAVTKKSDAVRLTWTIEFRDLTAPGEKPKQSPSVEPPTCEIPDAGRASNSEDEVAAASSANAESADARGKDNGINGEPTVASEEKASTESYQHEQDVESRLRKTAEELAARVAMRGEKLSVAPLVRNIGKLLGN